MLEQLGISNWLSRVHPNYPRDWAVMIPMALFGDKVVYSGSVEELRGALGVITNVTHVKKSSVFFQTDVFEWRYTITIDNSKGSTLRNVREESFTKV